jgi:hypothetical protein
VGKLAFFLRLTLLLLLIHATTVVALQNPQTSGVPELSVVLARAAAYVEAFEHRLGGIVAEEHYEQYVRTLPGINRIAPRGRTHRTLRSDLLLVRMPDADRWVQFRDVFEVDGAGVRDRSERLVKLFLERSATGLQEARQIQAEGSRYDIGNIERTINVPVMALIFLEARHQPRFAFKRVKQGIPSSVAPLAREADIWTLEYKETAKDTLIRTTNYVDMPSRGMVWIDASNGRVLRTEHIVEDTAVRGQIDVSYRLEPSIELLVPSEMRERYFIHRQNVRIDGTATYSRFRQFQVKTTETIK